MANSVAPRGPRPQVPAHPLVDVDQSCLDLGNDEHESCTSPLLNGLPHLRLSSEGFVSITSDDFLVEENTVSMQLSRRQRRRRRLDPYVQISPEDIYKSCHSTRRLYCVQWSGGGGITVRVHSTPAVILPHNKK
ncbi:E4 ORF6/7 [Bat mastadenovirus WIV10]|uniref:E4 ORF6/7 n=1 Tax=Bat mastadenovirus WIV10 TaxID=1788432 RepID=A0A161DYA4_9ADEN|nr:E4 ORF6/7 [Bat mastadenovirus WIV10]AMB43103.1 E4 ORF6/7 [Bat mastadenovirus WIV10]